MASRRELDKLQDENRTICQRLSDVEVELRRKEDALKAATSRKTELLTDIREYHRKVKDLSSQLEKSESAELEARGSAHDARQAREHAETSLRDQAASSKTAINSLQLEIKNLKSRLADKEDRYETAVEQLHHKDEQISSMRDERLKLDHDGSSRLANLNQALMQAKQSNVQLTDENSTLIRRERELIESYETLERKYEDLVAQAKEVSTSKSCLESQCRLTPVKRYPTTPIKPIPGETELEALQIENAKLKKDYQCLQTNFQFTTEKSAKIKKEMKDMERSLEELQVAYDQILGEKEDLQQMYEEAKLALVNKSGSEAHSLEKGAKMEKELASLRVQSDNLQQQYFDLQEKLKTEDAHSLENREVIKGLNAQIRVLRGEKAIAENELSSSQEKLQELEAQLLSHQGSRECRSEKERKSSEAVAAYERKVTRLKRENEDLKHQLAGAGDSLEDMQDKVRTLKERTKSLEAKTARLEAHNQLLDKQAHDKSRSESEAELQEKLVVLSQELHELGTERRELKEANDRLDLHTQELTKANSKLRREASHHWELAKKLQKELEKHESCLLRAEVGLQEKEHQRSKVSQVADDLKLELESVTNAKRMYEIEVGKLISKLEDLEQCNFELSIKLADAEGVSSSVKAYQGEASVRIEHLETTLATTRTILVEKELQVTELCNTNELMERENRTLVLQVNSLTEMVATRNAKIEVLQSQVSRYESDSADIAAMITDLELSHGQCANTKWELQQEIEDIKESLEMATTSWKEAESTILSLKLDLSQLQEYNNCLESINGDLQEKIKNEIAKSEELSSMWQETQRSQQEAEEDVRMKSVTVRAALEEVEFIKTNSEDVQATLRAEIESLESKCSELRATCEEMEREKSEAISQVKQVRNEVKDFQRFNSCLKAEKEAVVTRFEESSQQVSDMKEELLATQGELKQTKAELSHQKKRVSEAEREGTLAKEELVQIANQYDRLKESMLSLLDQPSEPPASENAGAGLSTPTKKKLKSILKNSGPRVGVLKAVENLDKEN